jgi:rare lipoprotein A (peptidoglycan hydrolase)
VGRSGWRVAPAASWYGPGLYGNRTACGQILTRRIVGVAHRTLPCGTLVQIRWQGQSAVVPVIDRGPFGHRRNVFDLSARLACVVLRPNGAKDGCFTRYHLKWRIVERRRS